MTTTEPVRGVHMEKEGAVLSTLFGLLALYGMYSGGKRALQGASQIASGREGGWGNLLGGVGEFALSATPSLGAGKALGAIGKIKGLGGLKGVGSAVERFGAPIEKAVTGFGGKLLSPVSKLTGWRPGSMGKNLAGFIGAGMGLDMASSALGGTAPSAVGGAIGNAARTPYNMQSVDPMFGMQQLPQGIY